MVHYACEQWSVRMRILTYNPEAGFEPKKPTTTEGIRLRDGVTIEVDVRLEVNTQSEDLEIVTTPMVVLGTKELDSRVDIPCDNVIEHRAFLSGIAINLASFAVAGQYSVTDAYEAAILQLLQEEANVTIEPSTELLGDHPEEILVTIECRGQVFTGRTSWENVEHHLDETD